MAEIISVAEFLRTAAFRAVFFYRSRQAGLASSVCAENH
jgi:hypothetical protein